MPVRLGSPGRARRRLRGLPAAAAAVGARRGAEAAAAPGSAGAGLAWPRPVPVLAGGACVALAAVLARRHAHPGFRAAPGELVVSFLDVGQGDATLIQDGDGAACCSTPGRRRRRRQSALRDAGVRRLDLLVAHPRSRATTRAGATP